MSTRALPAAAGLILALTAGQALAQPTAAEGSLDQRVLGALTDSGSSVSPNAELTGSGDLVLLQRRKLFTARVSATSTWTDNAFLAPTGEVSDQYWVGDATVGASTVIAGRVRVHANTGVLVARYDDNPTLDYDAAIVDVGAAVQLPVPVGVAEVSGQYVGSWVYDTGFDMRQLIQHRFAARAAWLVRLDELTGDTAPWTRRVTLQGALTAELSDADPDVYDSTVISAGLGASVRATPRLTVAVTADAYRREYDAYYPGLLGVDRRDEGVRGVISAAYRINEHVDLTASWSSVKNGSTSDINRYDVNTGGARIGLSTRF